MAIDPACRGRLLALARRSIQIGRLRPSPADPPSLLELPPPLRTPRSTFVTLRLAGVLRGCRGTLETERPLAHDVWHNAWASAYDDPRFPLLEEAEATAVEISISVLSALEPVRAATRAQLLSELEPGRHGLVIAAGGHRATFLPQVWGTLPEPDRFVDELLAKAGLTPDPWSPQTRAWRYTAESVSPAPR